MSWFQSTNLASFAKTALKEAQKTIDKALEINEADPNSVASTPSDRVAAVTEAASDFFASWGVTVGSKKSKEEDNDTEAVTVEGPPSGRKHSLQNDSSNVIKNQSQKGTPSVGVSVSSSNSHKRSSSTTLETSKSQNPSSIMHKSLTSDIPVTLMAAFHEPLEGSGNHHTRSLSDTNLKSWDDFGDVQSLDEPDGSNLFSDQTMHQSSIKHNIIDYNSVSVDSNLLVSLNSSSISSTGSGNNPPSSEQEVKKNKKLSKKNRKKNENVSNLVDISSPIQYKTEDQKSPSISSSALLKDKELSNIDLLSTIDLNATTSTLSNCDVEVSLLESPSPVPPSLFDSEISSTVENNLCETIDKDKLASEKENESYCDNVSWTDQQDSSGFGDSETSSTATITAVSVISKDMEDPSFDSQDNNKVNENQPIGDSGFETEESKTQQKVQEPDQKEVPSEQALYESQKEKDIHFNLIKCSYPTSPHHELLQPQPSIDETETFKTFPKVTSPPPPLSSISVTNSPQSTSPHSDHLVPDSQRDSPNEFEMLQHHQEQECLTLSNTNQEYLSTPPPSHELSTLTFGCSHSQPESSRSSSIVVISRGDGERTSTPSEGSSGGSTGSVEVEGNHNDIEDPSSGFERVEALSGSHVEQSSSSPEVSNKGKHKKGASSASSSDIEVIPSDYSCHSVPEKKPQTSQTSSISLQTALVPCHDTETQTDFHDEAKALLEKELPKKLTLEISEMLSEKDQMIEQLREEGEKLSKKQFDLSQIVKKLRSKEKESDLTIKLLKGELAGKNLENERLMKSFVTKEGVEQTQKGAIGKLNAEKRALELKIEQMRSEFEDSKENCTSMKASVEEASIEILELKNAISAAQRDSTELDSLTREKCELLSRNEFLQKEVEHLRSTVNSTQSKASTRESSLQSEIATLTRKVHSLEYQLADISSEVADATMPLSLEIEKIQDELKNSNALLEKRESSLQTIVSDYDLKLQSALDREKYYKDLNVSLQSNLSKLELRIQEIEYENKNLARESAQRLEREGRLQEEKVAENISKLKGEVHRLVEEVDRLSKENDLLGLELKSEKSSCEQERKKSQSLMEQINHNRNHISHHQQPHHTRNNSMGGGNNGNGNNIPGQKSGSGEDSPSEHSVISETSYLDEAFDSNNGPFMMNNRSMTPKSFFESFSSMGLIENLQSQLRQRETEVMQFQDEVTKNEKIRKSLNEAIAKLTMQNEEFQIEIEKLSELQERLDELEKNNNALLQMYGEKVEEVEELRMDLQDVKDMYKAQIETLLKK